MRAPRRSGLVSYRPRAWRLWREGVPNFSWGREIGAGVTVGLIALPLSLALGIASVPAGTETPFPIPALGIFTAIIAGLLIALFGGSRVQIGGPTAAFVPIILLVISEHGYTGLILATMMAGLLLIVMGLTGMGALIKYIPWPVTSGFTTGIAAAIMLTQVVDFLGIQTDEAAPRAFGEKILWLVAQVPSANPVAVLLSVGCVVFILVWNRQKWAKIPGPVVALVLATLVVTLFGLVGRFDLVTIGTKFGANAIPSGLPLPQLPTISGDLLRELLGPAIAIALLGAIESLLSATVADSLSGDRHDSNAELVGQGIANLVCPFFGGLPATGAIARTSANVGSGGQTPLAAIIHALTLLAIVLVASRLAVYIPMSVMAAILVVVALRMGDWRQLVRITMMPPSDAVVLITTFALTVVFDLVIAVELGMVLAAVLFIRRVSETTEVSRVTNEDMLERPEQLAHGKEIPEGVVVYRIFGPFLFGAAEKMRDALEKVSEPPRVLILRLHLVTAMDATGFIALREIVEQVQAEGGTVILSGIHQQPLQLIRRAGFLEVIGRENLCATFDDALNRAEGLLAESGTAD